MVLRLGRPAHKTFSSGPSEEFTATRASGSICGIVFIEVNSLAIANAVCHFEMV
jgi:hypothetical protein